jgi:[acyl-carrier-protein] S-malonyltransferase
VGMGRDFYETFPEAKAIFDEADHLLGKKLSNIIFEGPESSLMHTENCQTAIFVTSMAMLAVVRKLHPEIIPSICAGLSLGEYSAVCASQRISFSDCLALVQIRGQEMQAACELQKGTMAALFGLSAEEVDTLVSRLKLPNEIWVANYNCPGQTVVSGTMKGVEAAIEAAKVAGAKRALPLNVHGAFHSGLMQSATSKLAHKVNEMSFKPSDIALVMNVTGNFVVEEKAIRKNLIDQVTHSVRWQQGIEAIGDQVELFIEIGCGTTLSGMIRKMNVPGTTISINKVSDLEKLKTVI